MTNVESRRFRAADILYIGLTVLPILAGIVLHVLTSPIEEGVTLTGAQIYLTIPMPIQTLPITESQINSWLVILSLTGLCLYLTHGLKTRHIRKRQHLAEWIVEKVEGLVKNTMGEYFSGFATLIATILGISAFSSLLALFGLYPPTSDINIVAGWAVLVFLLITYYKMKCGLGHYLKGFAEPVAFFAPINVISELATPVSMAFRHYGNVLSGTVISVLVAAGLRGLSKLVLGRLPGLLGEIPFLQIGIPAILSIYFDVFSGCLQAYIFAMLTMMYVSGGFDAERYFQRKEAMRAKRSQKIQNKKPKNLEVI